MSKSSLSQIYIHIVFSTKNRIPWITSSIEKELYSYMAKILKTMKSPALAIGGTSNHCHLLVMQSKNIAPYELIKELKRCSSHWVKTKGEEFKNFQWQSGYAVFSVSQSKKERVQRYILNQKEHHRYKSFEEELKVLLHKHEIPIP